uniref:Nucleolar protein 58/56 N-terminal domain-containing protein n=1 Tax=Prolemur simus TaxID=1328070 RepID=A0A8C9AQQ5_PROSS
MLVLFEMSVGYVIFKVPSEKKLQEADSSWRKIETPEKANKIAKLAHFEKFQATAEALAALTALMEDKTSAVSSWMGRTRRHRETYELF